MFTAGSTEWAWGLADPVDPVVEQMTRNLLDRLTT